MSTLGTGNTAGIAVLAIHAQDILAIAAVLLLWAAFRWAHRHRRRER